MDRQGETRDGGIRAVAALAAVIVALVAFRTTLGVSFLDDSFYVAVPLRLAEGAHLFVDDAIIQSTGSLIAVPFVALWHALFGVSGIILATRLFYVAVATAASFAVVRALRPSLGVVAPVVAIAAVVLAPAYNTFAVSYNTTAQLAFTLCVVLVFAAKRDGSRVAAALAGALAVFGCVSYPPFALAAIPAAVVATVVLRRDRLWVWLGCGAAAMLAVAAVWFLATTPVSEFQRAFRYAAAASYSGQSGSLTISSRIATATREISRIVHRPIWWPTVALSLALAVPWRGRAKGRLAALLPIAVALPGTVALYHSAPNTFGVAVLSYLLAFVIALIPLAVATALRRDAASVDVVRLLLLGGAFSLVAMPLVTLATSSGFFRGMPGVGAAPFALAAILCWLSVIERSAGRRALWMATLLLLGVEMLLLFSVAFKDGPPLTLDHVVSHGAVAGIRTTGERAVSIAALETGIKALAKPDSGILAVTAPLVYVLTDAKPLTYLTWVSPGSFDGATIDYYTRVRRTPDIVVVSRSLLSLGNDSLALDPTDPLLAWITTRYTPAEAVPGFVIMRRR